MQSLSDEKLNSMIGLCKTNGDEDYFFALCQLRKLRRLVCQIASEDMNAETEESPSKLSQTTVMELVAVCAEIEGGMTHSE